MVGSLRRKRDPEDEDDEFVAIGEKSEEIRLKMNIEYSVSRSDILDARSLPAGVHSWRRDSAFIHAVWSTDPSEIKEIHFILILE